MEGSVRGGYHPINVLVQIFIKLMHKILSKCEPSLRILSAHGKLLSGGQRKWIISKDLEQTSDFIDTSNNTARSIRCEKDMMSVADQSKSVDNDSDHEDEEAWSAVEELSSK